MKNITLLDGGLGQEIYHRSGKPAHPLWSLKVMMEQPEIVKEVHKDFIKAGARVITTNSYTCTPSRLCRDGQAEWFESLQHQASTLALEARVELGMDASEVQVAGCLPPLIGSYTVDARPIEELKREYQQIIDVQLPYVDVFLIETISNLKEARAATEVALQTGKPVGLSLTLSDDFPGKLRSGESINDAVKSLKGSSLEAFMFNCSFPSAISAGLDILKDLDLPYGGYANGFSSVAPLKPGGTVDLLSSRKDLNKEKYASYAMDWIEKGATIVGGCCEVGPSHIKFLRKRLEMEGYRIVGLHKGSPLS